MSRRAHTCLLFAWWFITLISVTSATGGNLEAGLLAATCAILATVIGAHHPIDVERQ